MKIGDIQLLRNARIKPRIAVSGAVEGIKTAQMQRSIQWRGNVHLRMLGEDSESMLAETEYPPKSGKIYYACASTGLIFDKQTGACRQSSNVSLEIRSVQPATMTATQFLKWRDGRIDSAPRDITLGKRGPKPKGYVAPDPDGDSDE